MPETAAFDGSAEDMPLNDLSVYQAPSGRELDFAKQKTEGECVTERDLCAFRPS